VTGLASGGSDCGGDIRHRARVDAVGS
jgi:hypothetical protein